MSASSLIFLLIVAIWAAYLLQHWVRRREHLATARSVDRFSEAMRVLERRDPLPESPVDAAERRSYSVGLARPSRPSVTVKRAAAAGEEPAPHADRSRPDDEGPGLLLRVGQLGGRVNGRRVRGISLLLAVTALLTLAVLVPVLGLPWWALGIAGGVVLADLVWLRGAARRSAPREHATPAHRPTAPARSADLGTLRATSAVSAQPRDSRSADTAFEVAPPAEAVVYDDLAPSVAAPAPAPRVERDDAATGVPVDPHGWQPVPVPPPTYTLKAKAERRNPPAAEPEADTVDAPVFDGAATGSGTGPVDYSRVPTGELPFDGYALDEDLEELPAVYQAV
ncbi:MAG TPA: hypothetical protein VFJ12_01000 [Segeticoccus sp.]|nr:hypothetical protein [Segeticoccus sp.]